MRKFSYINENGREIHFDASSPFRLTAINGLSTNKVTVLEAQNGSPVGAAVSDLHVEPKDITFEGDFPANMIHRRNLIDTILPGKKGSLKLEDENGDVYFLEGTPIDTPIIGEDVVYQPFQFVFHSSYPYWQRDAQTDSNFFNYESLFKFPRSFSSTVPWKIAEIKLIQITNVINESSTDIGFEVRFRALGTLRAPEIMNLITREKIKMKSSFVMNYGDELKISTQPNNVSVRLTREGSGITENAFRYVDHEETEYFLLAPGDNQLRYGAESIVQSMEVYLSYRQIRVGV